MFIKKKEKRGKGSTGKSREGRKERGRTRVYISKNRSKNVSYSR